MIRWDAIAFNATVSPELDQYHKNATIQINLPKDFNMSNFPSATEITIIIKNSEQRYTQKFLINDPYTFDITDPIIRDCLDQAKKNFGQHEIEDIKIKATLEL